MSTFLKFKMFLHSIIFIKREFFLNEIAIVFERNVFVKYFIDIIYIQFVINHEFFETL